MVLPVISRLPELASCGPDAEKIVARAWRETLGVGALDEDWSFQEAGGDSLRLMHLVFVLEDTLGYRLTPGEIHVGLRRREMAALLHPTGRHAGDPELTPLILLPGLGGYDPLAELASACTGLARAIHISYPPWTRVDLAPGFDFDSLVRDVLGQVMSRSSVGPVLLAGYSFGGIVAFAVADGLTRAGYSVRFLGLLDSEAHLPARSGAVFPRHVTPRRIWRKLGNIMAALRNGTAAEVLAGIVARRLSSPRWKTVLVLVARTHRVLLPRNFDRHLSHELQMNLFRPMVRQWSVMSDLLPPLDAIAVLFRTDDHAAGASPDLGWRRLCPRLTIVPVPGTHLGMLRAPNLAQVCAAFARAIPEQIGEAPLRPTAAGA